MASSPSPTSSSTAAAAKKQKVPPEIDNGKGNVEKEETTKHLPMKEYQALLLERDQLKISLYQVGNSLKDLGFQVSDHGNTVQRAGADIVSRLRLSPEQSALLQKVQQQQQQQPQQ